MNYLAHFHLAGQSPALIQGALLGDFVKGPLRGQLPPAVEAGVLLHRRIDAFCDSADASLRIRVALPAELRRYSGIYTDVAWDYCLSGHWECFYHEPLRCFAPGIYQIIEADQRRWPPAARRFSQRLVEHDLLMRYGHWETVDGVLRSIGNRLSFANPLSAGAEPLEPIMELLEETFLSFYPRLLHYAAEIRSELAIGP